MKLSGISDSGMSDSKNQDGLVLQSRPQNGCYEELQFSSISVYFLAQNKFSDRSQSNRKT
jgi:hypothetical protein